MVAPAPAQNSAVVKTPSFPTPQASTPAGVAHPVPATQTMIVKSDVPLRVKVQSDTPFYEEATFWISLAAIVMSIAGLIDNVLRDRRTRRHSVDDEFWMREVLFPTAIAPIIGFFSETMNDLPADRYDPSSTVSTTQRFLDKFNGAHQAMAAKLVMMGLFDQNLYSSLSDKFNDLEDTVVNYCHANSMGCSPAPQTIEHRRPATTAAISGQLNDMLVLIKQSQRQLK